jgi:hypothetical protein
VPARDREISTAFYTDLGFEGKFSSDDPAYICYGSSAFHVPEHAGNFRMHLLVESADHWNPHIVDAGVAKKYGFRIDSPADRPWGLRDIR